MAISISYSKLNTFLSCLLKYQKQYVEQLAGEKTSSSSQQLGKYIHKVLEDYREGIDIHELSKLYETKYVIAEQEKQVVGPLLETAKMFYEPYAGLPYESELKLEYYIKDPHGSMEDIRLVGVIDKIYFDPNGKIYIIDFKTGKVKADNSLQMKIYTYLLNKNRQVDPINIENRIFYLRLKQNVLYNFNSDDMIEFENFITSMAEAMGHTSQFKHRIGYWCSYCEYKNSCVPFKATQHSFHMRGKDGN